MRFRITLKINTPEINKDKNRIFLSVIKNQLEQFDNELYQELYGTREAKKKDFCFAFYMKDCIFHRDTIEIPSKEIMVTFSTYDRSMGIRIYNAFMQGVGSEFTYAGQTKLTVKSVKLIDEKAITEEKVVFLCQSPCVAREHEHDNAKTWYHSLSTEKGQTQFLENLKLQAKGRFPEKEQEIDELQIEILKNKEVKVKHYGIEVLGNLATFALSGKTYLLDYFYKSGAGSLKSGGFGLLKKQDEVRE